MVDIADVDGEKDPLFLDGDPNPSPQVAQPNHVTIKYRIGHFTDMSAALGFDPGDIWVSTDADLDGDVDVVIGRWGPPSRLLENTTIPQPGFRTYALMAWPDIAMP